MQDQTLFGSVELPKRLLFTPAEVAELLAISRRKLWELTNIGDIPSVKIGRCVRYTLGDLQTWIKKQTKKK
ncbi:MAG: helix-turn-helix domain-containing protein [Phycisphaeraceae bacterium]|nr:helix-turn-helix domain-containing protein [Phycisphaeraceae bacterium]